MIHLNNIWHKSLHLAIAFDCNLLQKALHSGLRKCT